MADPLNSANGFQRWVLAAAGALAIAGIGGAIHQYGRAQAMTAELKEIKNTLELEIQHLRETIEGLDRKLQIEDRDWFNQLDSRMDSAEEEINFRRDQIIDLQETVHKLETINDCRGSKNCN